MSTWSRFKYLESASCNGRQTVHEIRLKTSSTILECWRMNFNYLLLAYRGSLPLLFTTSLLIDPFRLWIGDDRNDWVRLRELHLRSAAGWRRKGGGGGSNRNLHNRFSGRFGSNFPLRSPWYKWAFQLKHAPRPHSRPYMPRRAWKPLKTWVRRGAGRRISRENSVFLLFISSSWSDGLYK